MTYDAIQTIQSQMEDVSRELGLFGMTLANEDGLLLASSCPSGGMDEVLAAISPLCVEEQDDYLQKRLRAFSNRGIEVNVQGVSFMGQSLFLCAAGDSGLLNHPALGGVMDRIKQAFVN